MLQHKVRSTLPIRAGVFREETNFGNILTFENMVGTVVRAITLHQCGLSSILGLDAIMWVEFVSS